MNRIFSITILTLMISPIARATPSTHIWGPSTDIQPFGVAHITADYYLAVKRAPQGLTVPPVTNTGLTVGVLPFQKIQAEVGVDHKSGMGASDKYPIYFNAKLGVPEKAFGKSFPALAVGIYDIGTKSDVTNNDVEYAKIAKTFFIGRSPWDISAATRSYC